MSNVSIIGAGLHPFGRFPGKQAMDMGADAIRLALADAGIGWEQVQRGFAGSLEVSNPDAVVGKVGLTGIPFFGVFNGCATANTAVSMAADAIEHGAADIAIAVGFDKHPRGAFAGDPVALGLPGWYGETGLFLTTHFFGMKANRYLAVHDISATTLARVAAKNFRNGARNEKAWRRTPMTEDEILAAPYLNYPLTRFMYCAPNEGAGAVVLCRRDLATRYSDQPIHLAAWALRTRRRGAFEVQSPSLPVDGPPSPTVDASRAAFEMAGLGPEDVDVAQLQDTDAGSEIIHMAENGFCADGDQEKLIAEGWTEITGRLPVNTDGGLMANGEPIGASGLRQIHEIVLQLRGRAGDRQVPGRPRVGYTHLYGAPGTGAVTVLTV
jgi:acetyl-CoA acetyltransferase